MDTLTTWAPGLPPAPAGDGTGAWPVLDLASHVQFTRLLARAQAGDQAAFAELYEAHRPRLVRLAALILHDPVSADDIVQDGWLKAQPAVGRARFTTPAALGAWLGTIVGRAALSEGRRRRAARLVSLEGTCVPGGDDPWELVAPEPGPEELVIRREEQAAAQAVVWRILRQMQPASRRLLLLRACYPLGDLVALIEARSGRPVTRSALQSQLFRASDEFRRLVAHQAATDAGRPLPRLSVGERRAQGATLAAGGLAPPAIARRLVVSRDQVHHDLHVLLRRQHDLPAIGQESQPVTGAQ